MSVNTIINC